MAGNRPCNSPLGPGPAEVRRRHPNSIDTGEHLLQSPSQLAGPATPRSTLGSPLTGHACSKRSGVGDLAAGPRRRNSLSDVQVLPWLCCMAPAFSVFTLFSSVVITALFFPKCFYWLTTVLTIIVLIWIGNLSISSTVGAYKLKRSSKEDWHSMLEQIQEVDPDGSNVLHIVLLPNYKENEAMLRDTLENLGRSPLACTRMRVVLAMEAREGPAGREKADRLIQHTSHLFADIFATYHPEGLPGEVTGKSSNTQWAFRQAMGHYGPGLLGYDLTRVFLTVGDADTLWHPQYFSALTYQGLMMSAEERSWRIWQPPILLMRNIFTVPAMTRASAHATLVFELSALANQIIFPAFAYSAYSMTLALASHPEVDGWDADVIAEDHHMFCKCYFAALWELAHAAGSSGKTPVGRADASSKSEGPVAIEPQLRIEPIFLPAVSYLVESNEGYWASVWARFQQARRHSQGVVELGYVLLQYVRLVNHVGVWKLPVRTHMAIIIIATKLQTLHITTTAQCLALVLVALTTMVPQIVQFVRAGVISQLIEYSQVSLSRLLNTWEALDLAQQALAATLSQISTVTILFVITCFIVVLDLIEGEYYTVLPPVGQSRAMLPVAEGDEAGFSEPAATTPSLPTLQDESSDEAARKGVPAFVKGRLSWFGRIGLFCSILTDISLVGYPGILVYAVVPVVMAAWSLFRRGTDFEYIVAAKPE